MGEVTDKDREQAEKALVTFISDRPASHTAVFTKHATLSPIFTELVEEQAQLVADVREETAESELRAVLKRDGHALMPPDDRFPGEWHIVAEEYPDEGTIGPFTSAIDALHWWRDNGGGAGA